MEDNEDEPDDVKNATPVKDDIQSGERDEKSGGPKATRKKKEGNKPSRCEKNENKPKSVVKLDGEKCRNKIYKPLKASETMSVLVYSPACALPRMEIIPRHCLSKKEYIDVLAKPSRRCPDSCLNGKSVIRKVRPISARMNELSQPARRLIVGTLQERGGTLPPEMISNLVKSIEGSACLTPEQAENYFRDKERVKERKTGASSKCAKKRCKQEKGKSPCPSGLDKEAVICQYLMAERFVKSILQWKCPIPVEEFQDIATVILRRLSFVLEYTPLGEQEDLKSQQMRLLADIVACWISGVLFEVAEDHEKEIEEDRLQTEEEGEEETDEEEEEEEELLKPGKEMEEEEEEEEEQAEEKLGEEGEENEKIVQEDLENDATKEPVGKEEEGELKTDSEVPEEPIGDQGIVNTEPEKLSPGIEETVKVKEESPDREKEEKEAEEKARLEEEERRRQEEEEEERARQEEAEEMMKKKQKEIEEAAAEATRLEEEKKKKEKEAEEMAAAEEEKKKKQSEKEEEEEEKKKREEEEEERRRKEEEERRRKEEEEEMKKKKKKEEEKLKEVGPVTAIDGIGEGELFKSELPFITFGKILDTINEMVSDSAEVDETDPVQNRIQRAIYEKLSRLVELESPEALTENLKDVIDVTSGKIASWLKELLKDTEAQFMIANPPEVESKEIRDWGKWIDQVADRAVDWADWIHRVVKEAEGKSVGNVNRGEWANWTGDTDTDALLWRRYYLETVHQAHHNKMMMADRPVVKTGQKGKGVHSSGAIITEEEITNTDLDA